MTWLPVGDVGAVSKARRIVVEAGGTEVLVLSHEGRFYAFANRCIHKDRELSRGVVLNGKLVCPGHQWAFALDSGYEAIKEQYQPTFPVRVSGDVVEVDISSLVDRDPATSGEG